MKEIKWILATLAISAVTLFTVSCDREETKPDQEKNEELQKPVTESTKTPQEHMAAIEAIGEQFLATINPEDYRSLIDAVQKLMYYVEYSEDMYGFPMSVSVDPMGSVAGTMMSVMKGEEPSDIAATTTAVAELIISVENLLGSKGCELRYDSDTYMWDYSPLDKPEIKVYWDNASIVLTYSEKTTTYVYEESVDGETVKLNIEIPDHINMVLYVDDISMLSFDLRPNISEDGLTIKPELAVQIVNISMVSRLNANPEFISSEFSLSAGGVEVMSSYMKVVVSGMTNPDNWIVNDDWGTEVDPGDALENNIKTGEFYFNILNIQLRGEGDIRKCIDEKEKVDMQDDAFFDEAEAQMIADILNENIKIELIYTNDYTRIATIRMEVNSQNVEYYESIWIEPVLVFSDGTTMKLETFFEGLENELMDLIIGFTDMFGSLQDSLD